MSHNKHRHILGTVAKVKPTVAHTPNSGYNRSYGKAIDSTLHQLPMRSGCHTAQVCVCVYRRLGEGSCAKASGMSKCFPPRHLICCRWDAIYFDTLLEQVEFFTAERAICLLESENGWKWLHSSSGDRDIPLRRSIFFNLIRWNVFEHILQTNSYTSP